MINLANLAVLVEAVQAGSLAAAARRLRITPMLASRRLAELEEEVGARLMHRTTRSLSLTAEGEAFLPHARLLLEEEAMARASVRPDSAGLTGTLRVTASVPFGRKVVAPLVPVLLREHPGLRIDLLLSDSIIDIVAQGLDLAIRIAPLRENALVARRLADNPRGLYAAPAYVAEHGLPEAPADLARHRCLTLTGASHWSFLSGGKTLRQRVSGPFTSSSVEALHQACLGGLGIAMLSAWDVREEVTIGHLLPIPMGAWEPEALAIWAVYPTARLVPPKVRLFIAALEARLRGA
ncbi:DNA-binding transcriptional regulator, LysR family [Roseomonas rosea]|uniref:DNA-binding transcriptional regulator, LysR family n=1 Tax=Muricoccus roseus TaxID=198092 RepID=A0A1M6N2P2_9PROT|nr:LysR family transcriptional regulator [Roseomonas rosea]SHJ89981.1 DNA-binding transcriptional regulator, LysR family [Roseomonas rosea]